MIKPSYTPFSKSLLTSHRPYTDLVLSGSWDGCVRIWRLSADKKRLEAVGVLGRASSSPGKDGDEEDDNADIENSHKENNSKKSKNKKKKNKANGTTHAAAQNSAGREQHAADKPIRGIVNDIAVFERGRDGDRGGDGLSIICAVGKQHRIGRWHKIPGGRNGGVVFEIPRSSLSKKKTSEAAAATTNGVHNLPKGGKDGDRS